MVLGIYFCLFLKKKNRSLNAFVLQIQEAHRRFDADRESRARLREEQHEANERRKREIYLNGGYSDCVSPGCAAQGTAETNFLCKPCHAEQLKRGREQQQQQQQSRSRFYVESPTSSSSSPNNSSSDEVFVEQQRTRSGMSNGSSGDEQQQRQQLVVKLPEAVAALDAVDGNTSGGDTRPCRSSGCDFYGTRELEFFCSKCYLQIRKPTRS